MCPTLTLRQSRETVWSEENTRVWDDLNAENKGTETERIAVLVARFQEAEAIRKGRING